MVSNAEQRRLYEEQQAQLRRNLGLKAKAEGEHTARMAEVQRLADESARRRAADANPEETVL